MTLSGIEPATFWLVAQPTAPPRDPFRSIQNTEISVRAERGNILVLNLVAQNVASGLCEVDSLREERREMQVEVLNH